MLKKAEIEKGCLSRVLDDEPVFVLRARDKVAPAAIRIWAELAELVGVNKTKTTEAYLFAAKMETWQEEHGSKVPD